MLGMVRMNHKMLTIAVIVTTAALIGILTTPLASYASDRDTGETNTNQDSRPKNTGGGESENFNCDEQLIQAGVDEEECDFGDEEAVEREPEPDTATLTVCREGGGSTNINTFSVTGNNPLPSQFELANGDCQDVTIGPGMYLIDAPIGGGLNPAPVITGDCVVDPNDLDDAIGEIQSGETQTCTFTYIP